MTIKQKRRISYIFVVAVTSALIFAIYKIALGNYAFLLPGVLNAFALILNIKFLRLTRNA